jgi:hypothetical protein
MTKLEPHQVKCAQCGTVFDALRAEARYCSVNCRVAAYTARHKAGSVKPSLNTSAEVTRLRAENETLRQRLADALAQCAKLRRSPRPARKVTRAR